VGEINGGGKFFFAAGRQETTMFSIGKKPNFVMNTIAILKKSSILTMA